MGEIIMKNIKCIGDEIILVEIWENEVKITIKKDLKKKWYYVNIIMYQVKK